jgi:SAM-dependent methyltransferase
VRFQDVVRAWDEADPKYIHPTREHESEEAYWASGALVAGKLTEAFPAHARVVDFGCGDGRIAIALHKLMRQHVIGVDSSPRMLDSLREREPAIPTLHSDGSDLREQLDRPVDGLYSIAVLIHHDYASCDRLVGQLARAVRSGGLLVLDWPTSNIVGERRTFIEITTWSEVHLAQGMTKAPSCPRGGGLRARSGLGEREDEQDPEGGHDGAAPDHPDQDT